MARIDIPSSILVADNSPIDARYWVASEADLNTGYTHEGMLRFVKGQKSLYIKIDDTNWIAMPLLVKQGKAGTMRIRYVTSGPVASVKNVGTDTDAVLDFVLPIGPEGKAATIASVQVEAVPAGTLPEVVNLGDSNTAHLLFRIPVGGKGDKGDSAYQVWLNDGNVGTLSDFYNSLRGASGLSAYELAVQNGYTGTLDEWLATIEDLTAIPESTWEMFTAAGSVFTLLGDLSALSLVAIDGRLQRPGIDYTINGNTLTLTIPLVAGSMLAVQYMVIKDGTLPAWEYLSGAKSAFLLKGHAGLVHTVTVDGRVLAEGVDYTILGHELILTQALAIDSVLGVQYIVKAETKAVAWEYLTEPGFSHVVKATADTICAVALDGRLLRRGVDYTIDGKLLTLTVAQTEGSVLAVQYVASGSGITNTDEILVEGKTNKWFAEARAIGSKLAGYAKATTTSAILATHSILEAIGVLEFRLDGAAMKDAANTFSGENTFQKSLMAALIKGETLYLGTDKLTMVAGVLYVNDVPFKGGISQSDADLRYLQLTGGTITGPATFAPGGGNNLEISRESYTGVGLTALQSYGADGVRKAILLTSADATNTYLRSAQWLVLESGGKTAVQISGDKSILKGDTVIGGGSFGLGRLDVVGRGITAGTVNTRLVSANGTELFKVLDDGTITLLNGAPIGNLTLSDADLRYLQLTGGTIKGNVLIKQADGTGTALEIGRHKGSLSRPAINIVTDTNERKTILSVLQDGNTVYLDATSALEISTNGSLSLLGNGWGMALPKRTLMGATGIPDAILHVKGSGITAGSVNFLLQNSGGAELFKVLDDATATFSGNTVNVNNPLVATANYQSKTALAIDATITNTTHLSEASIFDPGSGYTDGTYYNVPFVPVFTNQTGTGAQARITVTGGKVTAVVLTQGGTDYKTGDRFYIDDLTQLGGTGKYFQIRVESVGYLAVSTLGLDVKGADIKVNGMTIGKGRGYGTGNMAIGEYALNSNSSGYLNLAVGGSTLYNNTTGYRNLAIGNASLYNSTTGYANIAIGDYSMFSLKTHGNQNVAVGVNSLKNANTQWDNASVAVGYGAMEFANNAGTCVAVGYQALQRAVTGGHIAVGPQALAALNKAASWSNIAIGDRAGHKLTGGEYNILIGREIGGNATTMNGCTIIGGNSSWINMEGLQNSIILANGQGIIGFFMSSAGNASIGYGNIADSGARMAVKGSGSTAATTNFKLLNNTNVELFKVLDDGAANFAGPVTASKDVEVTDFTQGVILRSPNGTRYRITVGDTGALTTTAIV